MKTTLTINQLTLEVSLGWPAAERATKQTVSVDIEIHFLTFPEACKTDELLDTICYDHLICALQDYVALRPYRLVEYLCADLHAWLKQQLSQHNVSVKVSVRKLPIINNVARHVCFSCEG